MIVRFVDAIGTTTLSIFNSCGNFSLFLAAALRTLVTTSLKIRKTLDHMERIGVDSLSIIMLTGASTGAVFAYHSYIGFHRVGGEEFIGPIVALGMTRELGPVLTGLMVMGRAGSAITAEIGTMQITEQVDALRTLGINPHQYLIVPRILAGTMILPFLSLFCTLFGIIAGYFIAVNVLGLNPEQYTAGIKEYVVLEDITGGLIKASVFGFIITWVGSYKGYTTMGGARGVGLATTKSVVLGSVMILIANYFLTVMLFET